ncbi:MAG: hypothetical protein DI538_30025 [Azospira oryzae]|nr:MAG: hypothetical protein DI538_30025 [Azospira oryzae]
MRTKTESNVEYIIKEIMIRIAKYKLITLVSSSEHMPENISVKLVCTIPASTLSRKGNEHI